MTRVEKGRQYFLDGYNCSQSVVLAFKDDLQMNEIQLAKLASGFRGGIGGLRGTCGAVTGMVIVNNLLNGNVTEEGKKEHYKNTRELIERFSAKHNTTICEELLVGIKLSNDPLPRTPDYYRQRPCVRFVETAIDVLEETLKL